MDNKLYDILAWINRVFLPAFATFATAILTICEIDGKIIGIISGILAAIITFMGAILQDCKKHYDEGIDNG